MCLSDQGIVPRENPEFGLSMGPMHCRLCSAPTEEQFQLKVLQRHLVTYLRCVSCGSLQTEEPYWFHESYTADVPDEDPTYLYRNLEVARNVRIMLHLFGVPRSATVLDFGGGLGIAARLLVESGWRAFVHDTFTDPPFPGLNGLATPPTSFSPQRYSSTSRIRPLSWTRFFS